MTTIKHGADDLAAPSRALPPYLYARLVRQVLGYGRQYRNPDYRLSVGLSQPRPSLGQIVLVIAGLGVGALWLWACAYSGLFL